MSASSSMASLSRRLLLSRSLYHSNPNSMLFTRFCTTSSSSSDGSDSDEPITPDLESDPTPSRPNRNRSFIPIQPLENGVDVGIYKAILVGQVRQTPMQKRLKSGAAVTMFSLGTGGIRNNRRPFQTESPTDSIIYVEGHLETKIFTDPLTGPVRRIREIAVRKNGRLVFLGNGNTAEPAVKGIRGVGYY
ncbi:hypothetical protein ACLB2K_049435 [Fragaria x ananassa]